MERIFLSTLTLASALTAASHGAAQNTASNAPENDAEGLPPEARIESVYVTAGAPVPGERMVQAASIDVLEGLEKELRQGASLGDSLEHLPGVRNLSTGNNAGIPVIRGLMGNRTRMLSNGIGVDYQQYGIRHQPTFEPFLSERIEVVRGTASLLYGSDAVGGVIDVHSLGLNHGEGADWDHSLNTRLDYASNNKQRDVAIRGSSSNEDWAFAGGLVVRTADNIETPDVATAFESGDSSGPAFTGELPFTDFDQLNGQLGASWQGPRSTTSLRFSRWDTEQNYLLPAPPDGAGIGIRLENSELQLRNDRAMTVGGTNWTLSPTLSWQNNLRQANQPGNPRSDLFDGDIDIEFDQYTLRLEASHDGEDALASGTLGFEVRYLDQDSTGRTVLVPGGTTRAAGLFAYEQRGFGLLLLQAGVRYDHLEVEADADKTSGDTGFAGRVGNDYDVFSGALGGSYPLGDHFTVAANIARGFRAPSLFELFANGVHGGVAAVQLGNPDLEAEEPLNLDLALRWRFDRVTGSVTAYNNRIDNYIFLLDTGEQAPNGLPIFAHDQADATIRGVEAELVLDVMSDLSLRLVLDLVDTENRASNESLPLTPANEVLTELTWRPDSIGGLRAPYFRGALRYADAQEAAPGEPFAQFDRNPRFGSASTDSYWLLDLSAGFQFRGFGNQDMRLNLALRNALDEDYRDFLNTYKGYTLNPGRDLRVTLEIPLG